jgi:predicted DNA binding CopG/RHH family protein
MKIDADEILTSLQNETSDKKAVSIYVSEQLVESFKAACEGVPFSKVLEKLMELFIQAKKS